MGMGEKGIMTAAFMLILGLLLVWLAASGKWAAMMNVIRKAPSP